MRLIPDFALWTLAVLGLFGLLGCSGQEEPEQVTPPPVTPQEPVVAASEQVDESANYAVPPAAMATPAGLDPQFGGLVQALGQYVVELLSRDDGHLEAQVRDLQGQPVDPQAMEMTAEIQNQAEPAQVVMLPSDDRFVGTVADVAGTYPVNIVLSLAEAVEPIARATYNDLVITPIPDAPVAPQHHGRVSVVGDTRVEVTTTPNRQVYVSVTDLQGNPIPPGSVTLNQIQIVGPAGPQVVALRPQGAMFVGTLAGPPPPSYNVVFDIGYGPRVYRRVHLYRHRPVAPTVVVAPPPRFHRRHWRRDYRWGWAPRPTPRVVVHRPPPPRVHVHRPPAPRVHVHAPPPPPRVKVHRPPAPRVHVHAPPPPPRVKVHSPRPRHPAPPPRVRVKHPPPPRHAPPRRPAPPPRPRGKAHPRPRGKAAPPPPRPRGKRRH